jgi:hypothetical protein
MQLLYNSDSFAVVRFGEVADASVAASIAAPLNASTAVPAGGFQGGYEIVDKFARKEIFLQGAVAARFQQGVNALVSQAPAAGLDAEALEDFIAGFTALAQQPLVLH